MSTHPLTRRRTPTRVPLDALLCVVAVLMAAPANAQQVVTIQLHDGRSVSGVVDEKTNNAQMWLRRSEQGMELSSGYNWNQISLGMVGQHEFDTDRLLAWAQQSTTPGRKFNDLLESEAAEPLSSVQPSAAQKRSPQALVIEARLAQWDDDSQSDGLYVSLAPLDSNGQIVPVSGRVRLKLVTERDLRNSERSFQRSPTFVEAESTSHEVRIADFQNGPAVYKLPFSRSHPDFEPGMAWVGLVHARLSIPGCCALEASDASVALQELSCFRDQLQLYTPGRYLQLESGGGPSR